ncbi:hypothetical protein ADUPG1_007093, partial [Aduncisulcus paluster]
MLFLFFDFSWSVYFAGKQEENYGGVPAVAMTFTIDGLRSYILKEIQPFFDDIMGSFDFPDFTTTLDFGIGKASVSLLNFCINSYNFFPEENIILATYPNEQLLSLQASNAGVKASVDYDVKLLTYPYSHMDGSASLSIGNFGVIGAASAEALPDWDDQTCGNVACGLVPGINLEQFDIKMDDVVIEFIGDSDVILETIANLLDS